VGELEIATQGVDNPRNRTIIHFTQFGITFKINELVGVRDEY